MNKQLIELYREELVKETLEIIAEHQVVRIDDLYKIIPTVPSEKVEVLHRVLGHNFIVTNGEYLKITH